MDDNDWLSSELDRAKHEVLSWDEWKREAMRREATAISHDRETVDQRNLGSASEPVHADRG